MNLKTSIKQFIISYIIKDGSSIDIKDEDQLIVGGIIDSLGILKLLAFLQQNYSIEITPEELNLENFNTINTISKLVDNKLK